MNSDDWQDERDTWKDDGPDPWDAYDQTQQAAADDQPAGDQWSDWQQRGYDTPAGPGRYHEPPHSGLGIASVVLTVLAGLGGMATIAAAMVIGVHNPNIREDDPQLIAILLGILLSLLVVVIGGLLGLIGLFQSDRQKLFPILGCLFATIEVGGIAGLIAIGLAFG